MHSLLVAGHTAGAAMGGGGAAAEATSVRGSGSALLTGARLEVSQVDGRWEERTSLLAGGAAWAAGLAGAARGADVGAAARAPTASRGMAAALSEAFLGSYFQEVGWPHCAGTLARGSLH